MAEFSHQKVQALLFAEDAELAPGDRLALDAHLETCEACQAYRQNLEATRQLLRLSLHRRWDPAHSQVSIANIRTASRRQSMFKKIAVTAGTLAVIAVMALAVRGLSGTLSAQGVTTVINQTAGTPAGSLPQTTNPPTLTPTSSATSAISAGAGLAATATAQPPHDYTVAAGDNCLSIAMAADVSIQSLIVLNNLSAQCTLTVGQVLKVPYPTPTAAAPVPSTPLSDRTCETVEYTVQSGDTLASIAGNYHVPAAEIRAYNGMTSDTVFLGTAIKIPLCNRGATTVPQAATYPGLIRISKGLSPENAQGPVVWSSDGSRILFQNDGNPQVWYAVNRDGSGLSKLAGFHASVWNFPSDGNTVQLCTGQPETPDTRIYSVGFDGSNLTDVTNPAISAALKGSCDATFSLDQSMLAFTRGDGEKGLFVMDADGGNLRQVTDPNLHTIRFPFWSQDDSTLYFNALDSATGDKGSDLYQARIDNGGLKIEPRRLSTSEQITLFPAAQRVKKLADLVGTRLPAARLQYALPSPDGSQIAFTASVNADPLVFVISADGSQLRFYPIPLPMAQIQSWSPDGQGLVFSTETQTNSYPGYLYLLDVQDLQPYQPATTPLNRVFPAPDLLLPEDGATFTPANDNIILAWNSVGDLNESEAYEVSIVDVTSGTGSTHVDLTSATSYTVPASLHPQDGQGHLFRWWITPVRYGPLNNTGQSGWMAAGSASVQRDFVWLSSAVLPEASATRCAPGNASGPNGFAWPIAEHFLSGEDFTAAHPGLDLAGKVGEDVHAAAAGTVIYAGLMDGGLGNTIIIDHGGWMSSLYAHLDALRVSCGANVASGQAIGTVGQSGTVARPMLFFEILYMDLPQNPWNNLPPP